jgi:hypothetical protein
MAHAVLGASKAHRWIACPGSIRMEKDIPDEYSRFAAEGTACHDLSERCLREERVAREFIGKRVGEFIVSDEMAEAVQYYVDFVNMQRGIKFYEQRVSYEHIAPRGFGTADCLVFNAGHVHVIDAKFGSGVKVHAENNEQLMLYAIGAIKDFGFDYQVKDVTLNIVQPRLDHVSQCEMSVKTLLEWALEVAKPAAELAMTDDAPLNPGDKQCRWCRAKATCGALARENFELAFGAFDNLEEVDKTVDHHTLTADQLAVVVSKLDQISSWADAVKKHATDLLAAGGVIPGWKVVEGRSMRRWSDEDAAEERLTKLLGHDAFVSKLKSPAQAEKSLGREASGEIVDLIDKPDGKPTLAPESDKRPALKSYFNKESDQ